MARPGKAPPLMEQYRRIKADHADAILFFQVGDFYEMFHDDAVLASRVLELTLTTRDKKGPEPVPLSGFPIRAAEGYIAKLIRAGHTVAVCDQTEDPSTAKGIVKREVTRVITPGTITEDHLLSGAAANYLAACCEGQMGYGLAWVDVSTGDFRMQDLTGPDAMEALAAELSRLEVREVLLPEGFSDAVRERLPEGVHLRTWNGGFDPRGGVKLLTGHFGTRDLSGFGIEGASPGIGAAGAVMAFLADTQKGVMPQITRIRRHEPGGAMRLDGHTRRNLDLTVRAHDGSKSGTLLAVLDRTRTPMGGRTLREWLTAPLLDPAQIEKRADTVAWAVEHDGPREAMCTLLGRISDLERLTSRIAMGRAAPRDLAALGGSLGPLPELGKLLPADGPPLFAQIAAAWDDLADVENDIVRTLADEVPVSLKDGGVIRQGVHAELDELRAVGSDVRGTLARMEVAERERTGIDSLKIRHNNVFGYYIEVTRARIAEKGVPDDYVRKQTLVNAERFITSELKTLEEKIFSAAERIQRLEGELFAELRDRVAEQVTRLQWTGAAVGVIDTILSLAAAAREGDWVRPAITDGRELVIREGRHPVVEAMLPAGGFIANDTHLSAESPVRLVTGPNMAGKSTYLRQVALLCLLAQMGSFVPAAEAKIGVVDRIFSRIGASDALSEGLSTFMVEMTETAAILNNVTQQSLVILDEIGRGTSTFDGLSIAWAVAEHLHDGPRARTLFATHYHELTELAETRSGVKNVNVQVREWNDEIVFLHRIVDGAADRSYGIQVARLAGLPPTVVARAREVLGNLEGAERDREGRPRPAQGQRTMEMGASEPAGAAQFDLFAESEHPVLTALKGMDLSRMTPLEALNALDRLQKDV